MLSIVQVKEGQNAAQKEHNSMMKMMREMSTQQVRNNS